MKRVAFRSVQPILGFNVWLAANNHRVGPSTLRTGKTDSFHELPTSIQLHSNNATDIRTSMANLQLPPELLLLVMKQVDHGEEFSAAQNSLRNAILVNREWAEAGSYILWNCPPVTALAAVSPDRRQYYANKITEMFSEGEEDSKHHATSI